MAGIIVAIVLVALLYLIVANLLFSRTYQMVSTSLVANAETKAARLEDEISWPLAARYKAELDASLSKFKETNPDTVGVYIYNSKGALVHKLGDLAHLAHFGEFKDKSVERSVQRDNLIAVGRPISPDFVDNTLGYMVYIRSLAGHLEYRKNIMVIAAIASCIVLLLAAKLMQSQVSISRRNNTLLEGLEAQAEELRSTNESYKKEIDERIRAEAELSRYRIHLEEIVEARTEELIKTRDQLVDAKQKADIAEAAQNMIHQVSNILSRKNIAEELRNNALLDSQNMRSNALFSSAGDQISEPLDLEVRQTDTPLRSSTSSADSDARGGQPQIASQFDDLIQKISAVKDALSIGEGPKVGDSNIERTSVTMPSERFSKKVGG